MVKTKKVEGYVIILCFKRVSTVHFDENRISYKINSNFARIKNFKGTVKCSIIDIVSALGRSLFDILCNFLNNSG